MNLVFAQKNSSIDDALGSFFREGTLEGRLRRVEDLAREIHGRACPSTAVRRGSPFDVPAYEVRFIHSAFQVAREQRLRMSAFPTLLQLLALPRIVDELNDTRAWPKMPVTRGTVEELLRSALGFGDAAWLEGYLGRVHRVWQRGSVPAGHVPWRGDVVDFPITWDARLLPGHDRTPTPWQRTITLGMWGPRPPSEQRLPRGLRHSWTAEVFPARRDPNDLLDRPPDDLPTRDHVQSPLNLDLGDGLACRVACDVARAPLGQRGRLASDTPPRRMTFVLSWARHAVGATGYAETSWGRPPKISKDDKGFSIPLTGFGSPMMCSLPAMWDTVPVDMLAAEIELLLVLQWIRATAPGSGPHLPRDRKAVAGPTSGAEPLDWRAVFSETEAQQVLTLMKVQSSGGARTLNNARALEALMIDLAERFHACQGPNSLRTMLQGRPRGPVEVDAPFAEAVAPSTDDSDLGTDRDKLVTLTLRRLGPALTAVRATVRNARARDVKRPAEFLRLTEAVNAVAREQGLDVGEVGALRAAVVEHLRK